MPATPAPGVPVRERPPGPTRVVTIGSLPPHLGGLQPGGVATFHGSLLTGMLGFPERVTCVGVIPIGRMRAERVPPDWTLYPLRRGTPPLVHLESVARETECDVIVLNHVANAWGRAATQLGGPAGIVGINHSWTPLTRPADPFEAGELAEILARCDTIVFPSSHCRAGAAEHRVSLAGLHSVVIPHPLPPSQPPRTDRDRDGALFVGNLNPVKNVMGLIEAIRSMPEMRLTVVGQGPEAGAVREAIADHGLHRRVSLLAERGEDVYRHMERAEVLCLPSWSESFGLVMIEALARGTPVVGFGPTLTEIIERMGVECGFPLPGPDPPAIAEGLREVTARTWLHEEISRRARAAFAVSAITETYIEVFEGVTGARRSRNR